MISSFRTWLSLTLVVVTTTTVLPGDTPPASATDTKTPTTRAETTKTSAPRTLDNLSFPLGAILVIVDEAKNPLSLLPKGIMIAPEKYQELLDQIETLKRQTKPLKPDAPSSCKLSGRVDGDTVHLQAQFEFVTDHPKAAVTVGCQKAWAKSALLDGQLPVFLPSSEDTGLVIQVDHPKTHQLTLELEMPLATRGTKGLERGFEIGLPKAAITRLDQFTLPDSIPEVRINTRAVRSSTSDGHANQIEGILLGAADHLDLSWKVPAATPQRGPALLSADGKITIRVDETRVTSEVELNLQVLRGETRLWRIQLPPGVLPEVKEPGIQDERIERKDPPTSADPCLTIRLKAPSSDPLRVVFQTSQARKAGRFAIGPFHVLNAAHQRGTLSIIAPPDIRLITHPQVEVLPREVTDEQRRENVAASFTYWNLNTPGRTTTPPASPLELEIESVKGVIETRLEYAVLISKNTVQLSTKIEVNPIRTGVDRLDIQMPNDLTYDRDKGASPADLVEDVSIDSSRQIATIRLAQKQYRPFSITLPVTIGLPEGKQSINLDLPRPQQTLDRGAQWSVAVPEGQELFGNGFGLEALAPGSRRLTSRAERAPAQLELAWRAFRPDAPATATINVNLTPHLAYIQHQLTFRFSDAAPPQVGLAIPAELNDRVRVVQGGTLQPGGIVTLEKPSSNATILLQYSVAIPDWKTSSDHSQKLDDVRNERRFSLPLVRPVSATRTETRIRFWSEPTEEVMLVDGPWDEQRTEIVPERDSLPNLVLRSASLEIPLTLKEIESSHPLLAPAVIDRALIQVVVDDEGAQKYRARLVMSSLNTRTLDLEFPAPLAALKLDVLLDERRLPRLQALDSSGREVENGTILRLAVDPDLYRKPLILDLRYELGADQQVEQYGWRSTLYPPSIRGQEFLGRLRWQVSMPEGWITWSPGDNRASRLRWGLRGGLLRPLIATTTDELERWLAPNLAGVDTPPAGPENETSFATSRSSLAPLRLVHAGQPIWLLGCSLLILLIGITLGVVAVPRVVLWTGLAAGLLILAGLVLTWPELIPWILYGCEPGLLVLVIVLGLFGWHQFSSRRASTFQPSVARRGGGSSLIRGGSSARLRVEPSTVDAPPPRDSSAR